MRISLNARETRGELPSVVFRAAGAVTRSRHLGSATAYNVIHGFEARADSAKVTTDFRKIVECLHSAHYTDGEIVDYLEHFFGLTPDEAIGAVDSAAGRSGNVELRKS